jgi:hypothetical protein
MSYTEACELANRALEMDSAKDIHAKCREMIARIAPDVLDLISHA